MRIAISSTTSLLVLTSLFSVHAAETQLPAFLVTAPLEEEASSAPILGGNLLRMPVSTTAIPESLNIAQDNRTLRDALRNSAGVTTSTGNGVHDFFVVRGIDSLNGSSVLIDGVPEPEAAFYPLYNISDVHVFKGPGSFLFGGNSLAGTVNMLRKQPLQESFARLDIAGGSFDTFRSSFDGGIPGVRLNAMAETSDGFRDGMERELVAINPSFEMALSDDHLLRLQLDYARLDNTPDAGIPVLGNRLLPVSRKASFQDPTDESTHEIFRANLQYEGSFGDISVRNKTYFTDFSWESTGVVFAGFVGFFQGFEPFPVTLSRYRPVLDDQQNIYGNELEFYGSLETGTITHNWLLGLEAARFEDTYTLSINPTTDINVVTGQTRPGFLPPLPTNAGDATTDILSVYLADRIALSDAVSVTIGARGDKMDFEDTVQKTTRDDSEISPFGGVTVQAAPAVLLFANAGEGFSAPSTLVQGTRGAPEQSTQIEGGVRFGENTSDLQIQAAVFHIERENIGIPDSMTGLNRALGEQQTVGVELEATARLTSTLRLLAGYAWMDSELNRFSEYEGRSIASRDGNTSPFTPEHSGHLWALLDLPHGFALGTGLRATGKQFIAPDNRYEIDSQATWDAALTYDATSWGAGLHLKNITDETTYGRGTGSTGVRPDDGFSAMASVRINLH